MMTIEEALAHVPGEITPEIAQFAKDLLPRYIFTSRKDKKQFGYCTYCDNSWLNDYTMKHKSRAECPHCKNERIVKASGRGYSKICDEGYFVYYHKSRIDPNILTAVGYQVVRDYVKGYRGVEAQIQVRSLYVFSPGKGGTAFHRNLWYSRWKSDDHHFEGCDFERVGSVRCQFSRGHLANVWTGYSRESIAKAVVDTPFQYSGWQSYDIKDMTEFFDLAAKYPCVEYLTKLGFTRLINQKLQDWGTYGAVYWRGKTLQKVLRISNRDVADAKRNPRRLDFLTLRILQLGRKDGSNFSLEEAYAVGRTHDFIRELLDMPYSSIRKRLAYLEKQSKDTAHYVSPLSVKYAWRDYIKDCVGLEMDLTDENVLFPKSLYRAHQNTIAQLKIKADEELDRKIAAYNERLKGLYFRHRGLFIRAAKGTQELIDEGKALNHCVGRYAEGYAKRHYIIMVIRKVIAPWKPYYTVQVRGNAVDQCYGKNNLPPNEHVEAFLKAFEEQKLKPNKKEVAV